MAESIAISEGLSKSEQYEEVLVSIKNLVGEENNPVAILAAVSGVVHEVFGNFWTGFYIVEGDELVLGPYQGPLPCLRISFGKGVCGTAWKLKTTQVVPNVEEFPGHIACSSETKSEIVLPIFDESGEVIAVMDIDSDQPSKFDNVDAIGLAHITAWLSEKL